MNSIAQIQNKTNIAAVGTNYIGQQAVPIRVALVDSHPITLFGLSALLSKEAGYEVTGAFQSTNNITEHIKLQKPDIVLLDFHLPNADGLKIIEQLIAAGSPKIVVLTESLNGAETCQLIKTGVKGVLLKEMPTTLILQCLHRVYAGGEWMERNSVKSAFEQILRQESEYQSVSVHLSPREMNLALLIAKGAGNKEAAKELNITEGSVRVYLNRIYDKLKISNRLQLSILFKNKGLA